MQINDILYHPCSVDIIPFKITGILTYEDRTIYEAQATGNVGACGRVKVLLHVDRYGTIKFYDQAQEYEYGTGLEDFVEGTYYVTNREAKLAYYEQFRLSSWSNMDSKKRLYEKAKEDYNNLLNLIKIAKEESNE